MGAQRESLLDGSFFIQTRVLVEGMVFEPSCPWQGASQGEHEFSIANELFTIAGYTSGLDK